MAITKNREFKYVPKSLTEELKEVRKKYKRKGLLDDREVNAYIREVNSILNELNSYKKTLIEDKDKRKYALNFDFPIRKK